MKWILPTLAGLLVASTAFAGDHTHAIPDYVAKAIADPMRVEDAKIDDVRHAAELVTFAGVKPGDKVVEIIPGSGYFTRVFSGVVGPKGHVYGATPTEYAKGVEGFKAIAATMDNVSQLAQPAGELASPEPVDLVFTSQNYHDYPNKFLGNTDPAVLNAAVFKALKPGGIYLVIDHVAEAGSGMRDTDTMHRIDPAAVKSQVEAAGFEFVDQSDVLANPADDHGKSVFDDSIRHHTDQFVYKFRKPRHD